MNTSPDCYNVALKELSRFGKFHIDLTLQRVTKILEIFGNPQNKIRTIHVAGTNGKGSVCALLNQMFISSGFKTGLYTSPHIICYNERIKINNENIDDKTFADFVLAVREKACKNAIELTEFEILTVVMFLYFEKEKVDFAIIETGLGGRLDATNVIANSELCVITSISKDHCDRLGHSIQKIAFEKANIIKKRSNVVVAKDNQGFEIVKKFAEKQIANVIVPEKKVEILFKDNKNFAMIDQKCFEFNLLGLFQKKNLELFVSCLDFLFENLECLKQKKLNKEKILAQTLKNVNWDFRFHKIGQNIIFDGAHNFDGFKNLKQSVAFYFKNKKIIWIYASLKTKEYEKIVSTFLKNENVFFFEFKSENAVSPQILQSFLKQNDRIINFAGFKKLYYENKDSIFVFCGSFYLVAEIFSSQDFQRFIKLQSSRFV